jgi:hypothetical protein
LLYLISCAKVRIRCRQKAFIKGVPPAERDARRPPPQHAKTARAGDPGLQRKEVKAFFRWKRSNEHLATSNWQNQNRNHLPLITLMTLIGKEPSSAYAILSSPRFM